MKRNLKKLLKILLIAFLVIPLFPLNALADSGEEVKEEEKEIFEGQQVESKEAKQEKKEVEENEVKKEEIKEINQETQKNEHIVTFNSNGGSEIEAQNIYENEKIVEPAGPVKEGHNFKGWFTDDKFATKWNFEKDIVTENVTLYAKWDIKEFTVIFKDHDGVELSNQTIEYGKDAIAPKELVREGNTFIGWDREFKNVKASLVITAKYKLNEFVRIDNLEIKGNLFNDTKQIIESKAESHNGVLYQFWIKDFSTGKWNMIQDYSEKNTAVWIPKKVGEYQYGIHTKDKKSKERLDAFLYKRIDIKELPKAKVEDLTIEGNKENKSLHKITAEGNAANGILYQFWIKDKSTGKWKIIKDYSEENTTTWIPKGSGKYSYGVHIKDRNSKERLDDFLYKAITIQKIDTEIKKVTIEGNNYQNSNHLIKAEGITENNTLYQFWVKDLSNGKWQMIKDYSKVNSVSWEPGKPGEYQYGIHLKDEKSDKRLDAFLYKRIKIKELPKAQIKNVTIEGNKESKSIHKITADGRSLNEALYQFWIKDKSTGKWQIIKDYSKENTATWTPQGSGNYSYGIHIKDSNSKERVDTFLYKAITIKKIDTEIKELNINEYQTGRYNIKSEGISDNKTLYQFWVKDLSVGKWSMIQDYSTNKTVNWIPRKTGEYQYGVHIKDEKSTKRVDDFIYKRVMVRELVDIAIIDFSIVGTSNINNTHTLKADAVSANGVLYQFWMKDKSTGKWNMIQDYSTNKSVNWTPKKAGNYLYGVHIKDKKSNERLDKFNYKNITIKGALIGKTIMLDPGHGGRDSGAINGSLGIKEKNYNNALSMKIRERLIALGANVTFTRNPWEDKFIHLHDRTPIVNKEKPDLMLSVHHDSSANKSVSGMSVHYSSYRPGMDTSNAYVRYNRREYKFVREIRNWWDPVRKTRDPGIVYLDNGREKTVNINDVMVYDNRKPSEVVKNSKKFADNLYDSLGTLDYNKKYSYIKDHNLHMTRWSNVPTALIEAGFISNNTEVKRVGKDSERNKIAQAVVNAIVNYFK